LTGTALALVLPSAAAHATWNMLAKRSGGGLPFVWIAGIASATVMFPVATLVVLLGDSGLSGAGLAWMVGSACIHAVYFLTLQRGYRGGDLSIVYPLVRGTGPMLASIGAVILLGESPSVLRVIGAALILGAILIVGWSSVGREGHESEAIRWALTTGVLVAAYTLWDKHGVDALDVHPVVYLFGAEVARTALLYPLAARRMDEAARDWRENRREVIGFGFLGPLSYTLFLAALSFAPVTLVAPLREVSILIGVVLGGQLLGEEDTSRRALAATAMVAGIAALAAG
jgi:drug/metabolite transporter (DMT)-like permease